MGREIDQLLYVSCAQRIQTLGLTRPMVTISSLKTKKTQIWNCTTNLFLVSAVESDGSRKLAFLQLSNFSLSLSLTFHKHMQTNCSLLLGFVFPIMWYFATILYLCNYYRKDPRERAGLAASAIAVSRELDLIYWNSLKKWCFLTSLCSLVPAIKLRNGGLGLGFREMLSYNKRCPISAFTVQLF